MSVATSPHYPLAEPLADGAGEFVIADDVVMLTDPSSPLAESVSALRTHIMAHHLPAGRRSLAMCSPTDGVGCTSLAVNLAVALADAGIKTLLMDANLRKPGVQEHIVPAGEVLGLAQCLADEQLSFGDVIQPEVLPNLSVVYAGGVADRPQDLLASARFKEMANLCVRDFDVTIVDTPPSSSCSDSRRIAAVIGYALIVVGRDKTFVHDVSVLAGELIGDHVVVIGTVLNQP